MNVLLTPPTNLQEKMRGRNKLVPRLLGITRESVMRVDETTKEVLKTWPLTTVRRWAASPNSFTLVRSTYHHLTHSVSLHLSPLSPHCPCECYISLSPSFSLLSLSLSPSLPPPPSPISSQDFGDYSESFYSVQTTEGETISQLIAAYIDIIMKKTNPHHMDLQDDEEEPVIMEVDIDAKK